MTLLSRTSWLLALTLVVASACGTASSNDDDDRSTSQASAEEDALGREVLRLVNEERADRSLSALTWNAEVAAVAYQHCQDMETRNYFDHVNPDGDGPDKRLDKAGITYSGMGENIAYGQTTAEEVMTAWMGSQGHRENILNPNFTELGVGVRKGEGGPWWTQLFRRP